jgi:hypothetical protein
MAIFNTFGCIHSVPKKASNAVVIIWIVVDMIKTVQIQ